MMNIELTIKTGDANFDRLIKIELKEKIDKLVKEFKDKLSSFFCVIEDENIEEDVISSILSNITKKISNPNELFDFNKLTQDIKKVIEHSIKEIIFAYEEIVNDLEKIYGLTINFAKSIYEIIKNKLSTIDLIKEIEKNHPLDSEIIKVILSKEDDKQKTMEVVKKFLSISKEGTLHHIFLGDTDHNKISGCHYKLNPLFIFKNKGKNDKYGVSKMEIYYKENKKLSTMFPQNLSMIQIIEKIIETFDNKVLIEGTENAYTNSKQKDGMRIILLIDKKNQINTAYPKYLEN